MKSLFVFIYFDLLWDFHFDILVVRICHCHFMTPHGTAMDFWLSPFLEKGAAKKEWVDGFWAASSTGLVPPTSGSLVTKTS